MAKELLPGDSELEIFNLEGITPFKAGPKHNLSPRVMEFKTRVGQPNALLIATPECNYSISQPLKNILGRTLDLTVTVTSRTNPLRSWALQSASSACAGAIPPPSVLFRN